MRSSWWSKLGKLLAERAGLRYVVALAVVVLLAGVSALLGGPAAAKTVSYTELLRLARAGGIGHLRVDGDRFVVEPAGAGKGDAKELEAIVADDTARHELVTAAATAGIPVDFDAREPGGGARVAAAL